MSFDFQHSVFFQEQLPLSDSKMAIAKIIAKSIDLPTSEKRCNEILGGRYCAYRALCELMGRQEMIEISKDMHGVPVFPKGIIGSISHSHDVAVAIVGESRQVKSVGVDIEKIVTTQRQEKLKNEILQESELEFLKSDPEIAFTIIFSAKEAIYKALYSKVQKYFGFHEAKVLEMKQGKITLCIESQKDFLQPVLGVYEGQYQIIGHHVITAFEII